MHVQAHVFEATIVTITIACSIIPSRGDHAVQKPPDALWTERMRGRPFAVAWREEDTQEALKVVFLRSLAYRPRFEP